MNQRKTRQSCLRDLAPLYRLQLSKNSTSHGTRIAALIDGWQRSIDSRMDSEKRATETGGKFDQGRTNTRWKFREIKSREYLKGIWPGFLGSGWLSWAAAKRWRIPADSPGKQSACKSRVSRRRKRTEEEAKLTRSRSLEPTLDSIKRRAASNHLVESLGLYRPLSPTDRIHNYDQADEPNF